MTKETVKNICGICPGECGVNVTLPSPFSEGPRVDNSLFAKCQQIGPLLFYFYDSVQREMM